MKFKIIMTILTIVQTIYRVFNINTKTGAAIRSMKNISKRMYYIMLLKYRVVEPILLPLYKYKERKKEEATKRRDELLSQLKKETSCEVYEIPKIFMGKAHGSYKDGTIKVSNAISGVMLIDTMFHENRHHEQEEQNHKFWNMPYIRPEVDTMLYYNQPIEVDARRHAYIKTVRFLKANYPSKARHLALYKILFHPWKGWVKTIVRLEARFSKK